MENILTEAMLQQGKFWSHPWGLIRGCTPASTGCANCWLVRMSRLHNDRHLLTADAKHFNGSVECVEGVLTAPIASRKRRPRVWAIWSDFYHADVPDYFRDNAFEVMSMCPSDTFLIITKRPENAVEYSTVPLRRVVTLPNVIHLVTMENQEMADARAPYAVELAGMGWKVGALCEPLLGPVDLRGYLWQMGWQPSYNDLNNNSGAPDFVPTGDFEWIITGPENGSGKRPFNPAWALSLRDQAINAGVPFMFKDGPLDGRYHIQTPE